MKTSTKIFVVYGSIVVALQLIFLIHALIQYQRLKPLGVEMSKKLENTAIHHIVIDAPTAKYDPARSVFRNAGWDRNFFLDAYLATSHISNDTLYIKGVKDYNSVLQDKRFIGELRSTTIFTSNDTIRFDY